MRENRTYGLMRGRAGLYHSFSRVGLLSRLQSSHTSLIFPYFLLRGSVSPPLNPYIAICGLCYVLLAMCASTTSLRRPGAISSHTVTADARERVPPVRPSRVFVGSRVPRDCGRAGARPSRVLQLPLYIRSKGTKQRSGNVARFLLQSG